MLDNVLLMKYVNGVFINARAKEIDWNKKQVVCEDTTEESKFFTDGKIKNIEECKIISVDFDVLVIDIGSSSKDSSNIEGVFKYTIPTRPISKLIYKIQEIKDQKSIELVIVGSGAAGTELACCLKSRLKDHIKSIQIIDRNKSLTKSLGDYLGPSVEYALKLRNIKMLMNVQVIKIEDKKIYLSDGSTQKFDICIWSSGAEPSPFHSKSGLQLDKDGWIQVNSKLQSISHPNVFAAGDCISLENGPKLSKAGVYAVREGPILETNVLNYIENEYFKKKNLMIDYNPQNNFLKIINYGDGTAVMDYYGYVYESFLVWNLKDFIDRKFMNSFPMAKVNEIMEIQNSKN